MVCIPSITSISSSSSSSSSSSCSGSSRSVVSHCSGSESPRSVVSSMEEITEEMLREEIERFQRELSEFQQKKLSLTDDDGKRKLHSQLSQFRNCLQRETELLELQNQVQEEVSIELDWRTTSRQDDRMARTCGQALLGPNCHNITSLTLKNLDDSHLTNVQDAQMFIKFIRKAKRLTRLQTKNVRNKKFLSVALQAAAMNPSIQCVSIDEVPMLDKMMNTVLLVKGGSLQHLELEGDKCKKMLVKWSSKVDFSNAFIHNKTLEQITFRSWYFSQMSNPFSMFAKALDQSTSVHTVQVSSCSFDYSSTKFLLALICHSHSKLKTLQLREKCKFVDKENQSMSDVSFLAEIVTTKASTASIQELSLQCENDTNVVNLFVPLQSQEKTLQRIQLLDVNDVQANRLVEMLPSLRGLKSLDIRLKDDYDGLETRFLEALKKNSCLQSLTVSTTKEAEKSQTDQTKKMKMYSQRNQFVQESRTKLLENETYIPYVLSQCLQYESSHEIVWELVKLQQQQQQRQLQQQQEHYDNERQKRGSKS